MGHLALVNIRLRPSAMGFEFHVSLLPKKPCERALIIYLKVIFSVAKALRAYSLCPLISSKIDFIGNINTIFNRSYRTRMTGH